MNESWLDRNQNKIFYGMLGVIFVICIIAFLDVRVFAATNATGDLPYVVPNYRNANSAIPQEVFDIALARAETDARTFLNYQGDLYYMAFVQDGYVNNAWYEIFFVPNPSIEQNVLESTNFLDESIRFKANNIQIQRVLVNAQGQVGGGFINLGTYADLLGRSQTVEVNGGNITPRYPFFYNGPDIYSANGNLVVTNTVPAVAPNGHPTAPDFHDTGHAIDHPPINKPSFPTITPFTPNTYNPPTIDTSTLESLVESLIDTVAYNEQYMANLITSLISWVVGVISDIGDYIVDTLLYIAQIIINNIQTGWQNFYDNLVSLFDPLLNGIGETLFNIYESINGFFTWFQERIDYANEPIDYNRIDSYWQETKIYELEDSVSTFCDDFVDTVTNIVPPQRLEFSVDFSNGPWPFNLCGRMYFNFDFYENIRHTIVPWILAFMYVGVVLSLIQQIPNILHGIAGLGFSTQQAHVEHMNNAEWFGYNWTHSFDGSGYIGMGGGGVPSTYRNVNGWYGNWREI